MEEVSKNTAGMTYVGAFSPQSIVDLIMLKRDPVLAGVDTVRSLEREGKEEEDLTFSSKSDYLGDSFLCPSHDAPSGIPATCSKRDR